MFSIQKCRELIPGSEKYTDEQVLEIRNSLYELAEITLDLYFHKKKKGDLEPLSEGDKTGQNTA